MLVIFLRVSHLVRCVVNHVVLHGVCHVVCAAVLRVVVPADLRERVVYLDANKLNFAS